jgi:hypothetical protein
LVKIESVNKVGQFGVLLVFFQLDVILLETVEGQLAFVLNQNLGGVSHELSAGHFDVSGEGSGEHEDLLGVGSFLKDFLNVTSHCY